MTWNFALLALDQVVNSAAKMLYMSGGQYNMPMVFRGPNGAALQLSAQHSQAWESWLAHIPGLKVVTPGTPYDAKGLLKSAIRDDNPVVLPRRRDALQHQGRGARGRGIIVPIGKAELKREGEHASIITHGKMVLVAMQAADQLAKEGINVDVVDLRTVRPMDVEAITTSVEKTNRAVVLEEGWEICGIGAQVVDYIQRECFDRSRRAGDARASGRRADAVREEPRARRQARRGEDDRRGATKSCTSTVDRGPQLWQPKSSWRRSPPRWKRGASSNG